MNPSFADTFYFLAMLNPHDSAHNHVVAVSRKLHPPIVTTAWVLTEVADALAQPSNRGLFLQLLKQMESEPGNKVVPVSESLYAAGLDLYAARSDKAWGLTDCISFVVMREQGITEALTRDRHFEQAGFVALLK